MANDLTTANRIYQFYRSRGIPDHVAAGMVGNFGVESSGFDPDVITGKRLGDLNLKDKAHFMAQWRGQRKDNLIDWAQRSGKDINDPLTQAEFALVEMDPQSPYKDAIAAKFRDEVLGAPTVEQAATAFRKRFERATDKHDDRRQAYAKRLLGDQPSNLLEFTVTSGRTDTTTPQTPLPLTGSPPAGLASLLGGLPPQQDQSQQIADAFHRQAANQRQLWAQQRGFGRGLLG